ncbi:MAG: peptidoglycan-associated lipoprotein Pal [Acidobacteriota bacterium]|nr:peptidoglycan-associated lipoprotein Pal [Acidobacteriota bacterium]
MANRKRVLAVLVGLLGVILLAGACHKKKIAAPPPPAPPPAPTAPTVTLSAEPSTIEKGQSSTLSWTSTNATTLNLQPGIGSVQAQGSTTVTPDESTTYTITATGPGGTATDSARVTVTVPPPPPPPPPAPQVSESDLFNQNIKDAYFDFNKSTIRPDAVAALTHDADFLKQHPDIKFTIEGHCDERGSEEYNLGLGDRRANAAKNYLVNLGVSADNITTISYGKDRPFCTEHTESCWQQNRRAHLVYGSESK